MVSSGSPHVRCTPMGRTRGEPDEIELAAMGVELYGLRRVPAPLPQSLQRPAPHLLAKTNGKNVRVPGFLDVVSSSARTEGPHGGASYVQMSGRNRIDPHCGNVEPVTERTLVITLGLPKPVKLGLRCHRGLRKAERGTWESGKVESERRKAEGGVRRAAEARAVPCRIAGQAGNPHPRPNTTRPARV